MFECGPNCWHAAMTVRSRWYYCYCISITYMEWTLDITRSNITRYLMNMQVSFWAEPILRMITDMERHTSAMYQVFRVIDMVFAQSITWREALVSPYPYPHFIWWIANAVITFLGPICYNVSVCHQIRYMYRGNLIPFAYMSRLPSVDISRSPLLIFNGKYGNIHGYLTAPLL